MEERGERFIVAINLEQARHFDVDLSTFGQESRPASQLLDRIQTVLEHVARDNEIGRTMLSQRLRIPCLQRQASLFPPLQIIGAKITPEAFGSLLLERHQHPACSAPDIENAARVSRHSLQNLPSVPNLIVEKSCRSLFLPAINGPVIDFVKLGDRLLAHARRREEQPAVLAKISAKGKAIAIFLPDEDAILSAFLANAARVLKFVVSRRKLFAKLVECAQSRARYANVWRSCSH